MALKFYTSVAKRLKLKVREFCGKIPTFVEVTGEKLVGDLFAPLPPIILNRVKASFVKFSNKKRCNQRLFTLSGMK